MSARRTSLDETGMFLRPGRGRAITEYLVAILSVVAAAFLSRLMFGETPSPRPMALFALAVATAAWYGGLFPGLFATLLSLGASWMAYDERLLPDGRLPNSYALALALFTLVGAVLSAFSEALHRGRRAVESAARDRIALERARRDAEQAAWESERRFRVSADAAPVLLWMASTDKACTYFNRGWLEFTGRALAQELGDGWARGIHPEDLARCLETISKSFEARRPFRMEYRRRRFDGAYRWLLDVGMPRYGADGSFAGYIGSCMDVHEQKRAAADRETLLETVRQALARAEEAGRMRDEFLATVSHELRNPLNAIVGWAHVLQSDGVSPEERYRALETIVRSAHSQARLVDDLLDVSRVISGKMRLNFEAVALVTVAETAIAAARPQADAKGVALGGDLTSTALVLGDAARLHQVVGNLLDNAIKFTPSGGTVRLSIRARGGHVELAVTDSGQGIADAFLPSVFELFRQAESGSRRRHGGMGLGLAIVRQLIELHGGTVHAESPGEGRGATFTIRLPQADLSNARQPSSEPVVPRVESAPDEREMAASPALDGLTVLVIEDDEGTRALLRSLLEGAGARVLGAASVAEAMALLEKETPTVILSDLEMPGESGYDFIRRLRARPADRGGRAPAAALTAYARDEDRRRALAAGFQSHIAKPVDPAMLPRLVADLARVDSAPPREVAI